MLVHACNTSTQEVEARGLGIHDYTHSEFKASPGYLRDSVLEKIYHTGNVVSQSLERSRTCAPFPALQSPTQPKLLCIKASLPSTLR